jgi:hypothetical protein
MKKIFIDARFFFNMIDSESQSQNACILGSYINPGYAAEIINTAKFIIPHSKGDKCPHSVE